MKNFLVTWYGITDFKSSLGFEKSGPILGALADGDYTDVIVLGYTKHDDSISNEEFKFKLNEVSASDDPDELPWDARIGFNLTGGTKLMYAGAMNACRKLGGVPFYVGGKELKITYLNDFAVEELKPITKVESFILLNSNGLGICDYGRTGADDENAIAMTDEMWKARKKINYLYKDIQEMNKDGCCFYKW